MLSKLQLTLLALCVIAALLAHLAAAAAAAAVADAGADADADGGARHRRQSEPRAPAFPFVLNMVCQGLQKIVPACSLVGVAPPSNQAVSVGNSSRRKRSFFNSPTPSFPNFPDFPKWEVPDWSDPWGNKENVTCPEQRDQAEVYKLSDNSANYPANQIAAALVADVGLFNCLVRTIVLDNTPPALVPDEVLAMSNASCPFVQRRLFSYFSVNAQTNCFVLQNFQENVVYTQCLNASAVNCQQQMTSSSSDPWHVPTGPSWGQPTTTNVTRNVNRCLADFQRVSVWSYCPALPSGLQLIRDRIIVPTACLAFSVPCQVTATATTTKSTGSWW